MQSESVRETGCTSDGCIGRHLFTYKNLQLQRTLEEGCSDEAKVLQLPSILNSMYIMYNEHCAHRSNPGTTRLFKMCQDSCSSSALFSLSSVTWELDSDPSGVPHFAQIFSLSAQALHVMW